MSTATLASLTGVRLKHIAILCGLTVPSTKSQTVTQLASHFLKFIQSSSSSSSTFSINPKSIFAIDVGLKNLSTSHIRFDNNKHVNKIIGWNKYDLHQLYPTQEQKVFPFEPSPHVALAHMSFSFVNDKVLPQDPSVVAVEVQRTRSNGNSSTLPAVMINYTFEAMVFAHLQAQLEVSPAKFNDRSLVSVTSSKMANFWINRFINATSAKAKQYRIKLLLNWIQNYPAMVDGIIVDKLNAKAVLEYVATHYDNSRDVMGPSKIDDLVDSFLYALMIKHNYINSINFAELWQSEGDLWEYVVDSNKLHLEWLDQIIKENQLEVSDNYVNFY